MVSWVALAGLLAGLACAGAASTDPSKPNFIILIADDLGYNDLSSNGSPVIYTPNIDALAKEGLKLTQFTSAAPICTPSRAALLTGRLPIRTGIYTNETWPLDNVFRVFMPCSVGCIPESEITVADLLRDAGYFTGAIGKWHLGSNVHRNCTPTQKGFDYFYGLPYSHEEGFPGPPPASVIWPALPLMENHNIIQQPVDMTTLTPNYVSKVKQLFDALAPTGGAGGADAEPWRPEEPSLPVVSPSPLPSTANPQHGQPFFLYVGFEESHIPLFASEPFLNSSLRGPYGDTTNQLDAAIGDIMSALHSSGLADNTFVIFTSDNGAWVDPGNGLGGAKNPLFGGSNAPFRGGKGSTWEGGLREPAVLWGPGILPSDAAGDVSQEVVSMMDLMPTFLDYAGVDVPAGLTLDGTSIRPLLEASRAQRRARSMAPSMLDHSGYFAERAAGAAAAYEQARVARAQGLRGERRAGGAEEAEVALLGALGEMEWTGASTDAAAHVLSRVSKGEELGDVLAELRSAVPRGPDAGSPYVAGHNAGAPALPSAAAPSPPPGPHSSLLHEWVWYWRESVLYAARWGPYKAHFFTRPGFGWAKPTAHDPPLLFNVNHDPAEANPLNTTLTPYDDIVSYIATTAQSYSSAMPRGVSQYEDLDWSLVPCCNKPGGANKTQAAEFWNEGKWGLALWDQCVCSDATNRPQALL